MKMVQVLNNRKTPIVAIDPALDKYRNKIMFPEKLEKANNLLRTAKLPSNQHCTPHEINTTSSTEVESRIEE